LSDIRDIAKTSNLLMPIYWHASRCDTGRYRPMLM